MTEQIDNLPDASFMKRLMALIYDAFIVFALLMLASAVGVGVATIIYGSEAVSEGNVLIENPFFFSWIICCWFYYYFYCWAKSGQTLAMKTWRMKLVSLDGSPIEMHQALIRFFTGFVGLSNITTLLPSRWALHDYLSKTRVVVLPKGQ